MTVNLGKAWKKLLSMALLLMVLAMALPASLSAGAEEDGFLGDDYRIDPGQYDISFLSDINMYEVKERDGSLSFYVLPVSGSEIRISGAEFRDLMPQLQGISQNGITYGTEIHEAGDSRSPRMLRLCTASWPLAAAGFCMSILNSRKARMTACGC